MYEEKWITNEIMTKSIESIIKDLDQAEAVAVSDGSFKEMYGVAPWVIENEARMERIICTILMSSFPTDQSAYQYEVAVGLYVIVRMVSILLDISEMD